MVKIITRFIIKLAFIVSLKIILFEYSIIFISKIFLINNKKTIIKKILLSKIFKENRKNINNINTLFIKNKMRFGNYFISINNAIVYCQFLGCKKIILEYNRNIYINNTTFYKNSNINITIETNQTFNSSDNNSISLDVRFTFYKGFRYLRKINRMTIFKKQLLKNLPKLVVNSNDLYIYIRGGDIFQHSKKEAYKYFQPPLCFYIKILDKFNFRKVFIISEDKLNPVIPQLLSKYSFIKKKKNNIKLDISFLIYSYNIVGGRSTFFLTSIKFNDNLKFLWEYDCASLEQKYLHLHYSVYMFPNYYTLYNMNLSTHYKKLMSPWINSHIQKEMMIKEKCKKDFDIKVG
jgi:hypothetical protein